jgi:hypothetical protein
MSEIRSMANNQVYRNGHDRIFGKKNKMKKKFVVLCGPGRSGTSLGMQLVSACGLSVGKCNEPNIPHRWEGLRAGYNEHPLSNAQGQDIETAITKLEEEGCNAIKLIHLYAQWIPRLAARGYDVHVVVTSRKESEIWESGQKLYTGWQPQAIGAICGTAKAILAETGGYLRDPNLKAYELPFQKVVDRDKEVLQGLCDFLGGGTVGSLEEIIRPDIVRHAKVKDEETST